MTWIAYQNSREKVLWSSAVQIKFIECWHVKCSDSKEVMRLCDWNQKIICLFNMKPTLLQSWMKKSICSPSKHSHFIFDCFTTSADHFQIKKDKINSQSHKSKHKQSQWCSAELEQWESITDCGFKHEPIIYEKKIQTTEDRIFFFKC